MKRVCTMKEKKIKKIPELKTEDEQREFWNEHDSSDYIDWSKADNVVFTNLKPTTQAISIRLPISLLGNLKSIANGMDLPYQSLIKQMLNDAVKKQLQGNS